VRPSGTPNYANRPKPVADSAVERARFAFDTLKKIYGGLGPVQQMNLRRSIKMAYSNAKAAGRRAPTVKDVCSEYAEIVKDKPDSMLAILSHMVESNLFETDDSKIQSLEELFSDSIILNLKDLGQDDDMKNMLVAIFLNLYYEYMLSRPFVRRENDLRFIDSVLVVDEADSIMRYDFPILKTLLLQGREFGVGVWLASQYLSHFRTRREDYKQPLLTWFIHKVPDVSGKELREIGLTDIATETAERIKTLGLFEFLYKTFNVPGRFVHGIPFFKFMKDDSE
jgi:DNA phosphorothioation-dependent restriction protein DptH